MENLRLLIKILIFSLVATNIVCDLPVETKDYNEKKVEIKLMPDPKVNLEKDTNRTSSLKQLTLGKHQAENLTRNGSAVLNTRRSFQMAQEELIKQKFLNYVNDTLKSIQLKIDSVTEAREAYMGDTKYRMGYVSANIGTLAVTLKGIKEDLDAKKDKLDGFKILEMYDKVKDTEGVVTSLVNGMKALIAKLDAEGTTEPMVAQNALNLEKTTNSVLKNFRRFN